MKRMMTDPLLPTYILCIALAIVLPSSAALSSDVVSSQLDHYILYFDEWRFDWDDTNDFDTDYHHDWIDTVDSNDNLNDAMFGCTHNLQTIDKKLCVLQSNDGDFTFRFKNSKDNPNPNYNSHSNMVSAAKQLSDYYDNIELKFDDDNYWSSIQSIDGIHGYEAIQKCQPFTFMELCAIYNPYADNLHLHVKLANFRKRRSAAKSPLQNSKISNANRDYSNHIEDEMDINDDEELSIEEAVAFAMKDYDDTLGYAYWRGNALGYDKFDERNPPKATFHADDDADALNTAFGAHTYYFNQLSFDWDDSRDWVSFSKQTVPAASTEEVGAHPDKLEEVGAHPKQPELGSVGPGKDTGVKAAASGNTPSRSFTKCTGAIPFIHKHACVTVGAHDAHLALTSATEQEVNILYNGLNDIWNEIDIDEEDASQAEPPQERVDQAWSEAQDVYQTYEDEDDAYDAYEGGRRRLQSIYERGNGAKEADALQFSFNDDYDWDEIVHSYGFEQENENNYGRFGHKRAKKDHRHEMGKGVSAAVETMVRNLNVRPLRPKLMHKTVPFLFPAIVKCVHTPVMRLCLSMDVHKKAVKLHVVMPRFGPVFKCIRNSMQCNSPYRLQTGKRIFNGIKKGMGLVRTIGRRNPYKQTKKHLRKAMKQIRKIRKHLKHLTRQIRKSLRSFSASNTDDNLYEEDSDEEDESMAQKVFDINDEKGLLFYAQKGTNDFNDIWDDDNEWNAIEDMTAWDGRGIRRKCLTIWKKRLCLCQFLGWLDGPEKYHCVFPHHETFSGYHAQQPRDLYDNVQIKNVNPKIIVHHFHHIAAAKQMENNIRTEREVSYPATKPNWIPLWMWQDIKDRAQNEQISKLLYSAQEEESNAYDDGDEEDDAEEDAYDNEEYYEEYKAALDEYYENSMLYEDVHIEDMVNLNEIHAEDADEEENEENMKQNAWIEMSESATHDFDTEWNNDEHWDEISDIKTWEGTAIKRKCLHLWKHRLCLCQFLGWMDTNKYKCIYHHRTWTPVTEQRYNTVFGHESDTKKAPSVILHDAGGRGPVIHHFVPITRPTLPQPAIPHFVHHIYHYGPYHGRIRRPRKRQTIRFVPERPIRWQVHNPIIVHHFHHVGPLNHAPIQRVQGVQEGGGYGGVRGGVHGIPGIHGGVHGGHGAVHGIHGGPKGIHDDYGGVHGGMQGGIPGEYGGVHGGYGGVHGGRHGNGLLESESQPKESEEESSSSSEEGPPIGVRGYSTLQKRWAALKQREKKEHAREKKFKKLLWSDRHNHRMWKLMHGPHKPVLGNTVTGQHIIAEHINPHGRPLMVSMHKHMPSHRPQWMPQGLFTNLKHKTYYMVHAHKRGDHSTVTGDENRFVHGSDIVSAHTQQYDVFDNYYYYYSDEDAQDEWYYDAAYDDAYYYYDNDMESEDSALFDKYNHEKYENEAFDENRYTDEFVDDWNDEWVISDVVNALENAFYNLFGSNRDDDGDTYWDSLEQLETKRGQMMDKTCVNIFDKMKCLCRYHGGNDHYHCHKKNAQRHRFYLDTLMPKETPPWMSAHDFEWLKDQRLSAFTEVVPLPDALMKHIEYNELFSIPFNALSLLVHPAIKMEHIHWHKDDEEDRSRSSAHAMYSNMYDAYDAEEEEEDGEVFSAGYINEYGDYIIDEFYNEMDGTKWVVTNEWTKDLNDVWQNEDEMKVFSASTQPETKNEKGGSMGGGKKSNKVETDAARTLSSKCMLVFGRNVCLCEFINWVYDHSGDNPLYRCYSSDISQQQTSSNSAGGHPQSNNANNYNSGKQNHRARVLNKLRTLEKTVLETGKKIDELVTRQSGGGGGGAGESMTKGEAASTAKENPMPKEKEKEKEEEASSKGWGSKVDSYGYAQYEYDDDNDADADIYSEYEAEEKDNDDYYGYEHEEDSVYDGYDRFYDGASETDGEEDEKRSNAKPNWWTDGDGFSQTVYIGTNTFLGLMLLSIFFGMIAASIVCGYLQFKQLFCKNNKMSITCTPPLKMNIEIQKRDQFELDPINEHKI